MPSKKTSPAGTTPESSGLLIRSLQKDEMGLALDWAAAEGWNPGVYDAESFHAADPEGFLIGLLDGKPVALISAVRYGSDSGFIGFYIVEPASRGKGYGWAIWQVAMARLAGRNVALDGVVEQQDNYRRSGFKLAWRNSRYQGGGRPAGETLDLLAGERIVPASALPFPKLLAYDRQFVPADRSVFLRHWIAQRESRALALVRGDDILGYGVLRPCRTGFRVGPFFAGTPAAAETLFRALRAEVPVDASVFIDMPEGNADALALARRHNMQSMFDTARMYTGPVPDISLGGIYGITTLELG